MDLQGKQVRTSKTPGPKGRIPYTDDTVSDDLKMRHLETEIQLVVPPLVFLSG